MTPPHDMHQPDIAILITTDIRAPIQYKDVVLPV